MGSSPSAELIWGIPIQSHDEDGEPTKFWDEKRDDWIDFGELRLAQDGHSDPWDEVPDEIRNGYDDQAYKNWKAEHPDWEPRRAAWYEMKRQAEALVGLKIVTYGYDGSRAILTSPRIKPIRGDAWSTKRVYPGDITDERDRDKVYSKANDWARSFDLGVDFYADAGWWLVASYG